ncbi:MAG: 2-oxo acid dehydrogenase subunit E2 [Lautropia sp.]
MTAPLTLTMPKFGLTMTEGAIVEWPIPVGQTFAAGDTLVVIETEKVTNELEATGAGRLTQLLVEPGETVDVGAPIAHWEAVDVDPKRVEAAEPEQPAAASAPRSGKSAPDATAVGPLRLRAARRMAESKQTIPHFYLGSKVRVDRLEAARGDWNAAGRRPKVTLTHLLLASLGVALGRLPALNRVWGEEAYLPLDAVDVGLAIDTDAGLVAPVLRSVDKLSLVELTEATGRLIERARQQRLTAEDFGGGMCTLSNAGMHGVSWMASIINPGQAAILGVGELQRGIELDSDGVPQPATYLEIVLSCDHRVLTGVEGAQLLREIRTALESPEQLFGCS